MSISQGTPVYTPAADAQMVKVQFDCRQFGALTPVVISSLPTLLQPFRYDQVNKTFDVMTRIAGASMGLSVLLTPFSVTPPVVAGVPVASASDQQLYWQPGQDVVDGFPISYIRIGCDSALTVGSLPDFVMFTGFFQDGLSAYPV